MHFSNLLGYITRGEFLAIIAELICIVYIYLTYHYNNKKLYWREKIIMIKINIGHNIIFIFIDLFKII